MSRLLHNLFERARSAVRPRPADRRSTQPVRRTRLAVEALEDRRMLSASPLMADADRFLTTPTSAWVYHGVTAQFLTQKIKGDNPNSVADDLRITDIEVESASPHRFSATLVKNTGAYHKNWWWYYGLTQAQLVDQINAHHARIVDLERYTLNGGTRYAAVLQDNTGANAKTWYWYTGVGAAFVSSKLQTAQGVPMRITDIERDDNGKLDVVMVANTGVDARAWYWYTNVGGAFLSQKLKDNNGRLIDLERQSNGNFSAVMVKSEGEGWAWYYGKTAQELVDLAGAYGQRVIHLDPYIVNGEKRFAAILLQNAYAGPPKTTPLAINFTEIFAKDDTSEWNDDEPYVITWVGNLKNPQASYARRSIVFEDDLSMDDGDKDASHPATVWGGNATAAPIASPDDLVILVAVLENDSSNPNSVVSTVEASMLPALLSATANFPNDRQAMVDSLRSAMNGAIGLGVASGGIDQDEHAYPQELRLSEVELYKARLGTAMTHSLEFKFDDGDYWVTFQIKST